MTKINFNEAPEDTKKEIDPNKPTYIKPGKHQLTCTGITESPSDLVGTPYLTVGFTDDNGATMNTRMYMSDASRKWSILKLKNMLNSTEQLIPEGDLTVDTINGLLTGKKMWVKVSGEEKMVDSKQEPGKVIKVVNTLLAGFNFTASLANGDSLSFDESKDITRLTAAQPEITTEKSEDQLPF